MTIKVSTVVADSLNQCTFTIQNTFPQTLTTSTGTEFTTDYYTYITIVRSVNGIVGFLEEFLNIPLSKCDQIASILAIWKTMCDEEQFN